MHATHYTLDLYSNKKITFNTSFLRWREITTAAHGTFLRKRFITLATRYWQGITGDKDCTCSLNDRAVAVAAPLGSDPPVVWAEERTTPVEPVAVSWLDSEHEEELYSKPGVPE